LEVDLNIQKVFEKATQQGIAAFESELIGDLNVCFVVSLVSTQE
jgi:hypothetical protein